LVDVVKEVCLELWLEVDRTSVYDDAEGSGSVVSGAVGLVTVELSDVEVVVKNFCVARKDDIAAGVLKVVAGVLIIGMISVLPRAR
jgi:hypothetical protein